ncbi:MAG: hypothetical protein MZV70_08520 [Desulfobacterales bacterium]|nr:hypothetical protein [Desulfobacterales bacterium]
MAGFLVFGAARRVRVYEVFVDGAKEGFQVAVKIIPYLVAILAAVGMLRASGAMEAMVRALGPWTARVGLPAEALPMALMRPLSGSGAFAVLASIINDPAIGPGQLHRLPGVDPAGVHGNHVLCPGRLFRRRPGAAHPLRPGRRAGGGPGRGHRPPWPPAATCSAELIRPAAFGCMDAGEETDAHDTNAIGFAAHRSWLALALGRCRGRGRPGFLPPAVGGLEGTDRNRLRPDGRQQHRKMGRLHRAR